MLRSDMQRVAATKQQGLISPEIIGQFLNYLANKKTNTHTSEILKIFQDVKDTFI